MSLDKSVKVLKYVILSGFIWTAAGFLIGAIFGIVMTWENNNMRLDSPQGSYRFWGWFTGLYAAAVALPIGILLGLNIGLTRNDRPANLETVGETQK
jgi:hypothetical protein